MKLNQKGIATIAVILYCVGTFFGTVLLWKPVTNMFGIGNSPQKKQTSMFKKTETKPILVYTDEKGREHIAMATKEEISNLQLSEESKLTLWQKIKNLGFIGVVLVILGFIFPPLGAILLIVWNKISSAMKLALEKVKDSNEELSDEAKKIVHSVDEGLAQFDTAIAAAKVVVDSSQQTIVLASNITDSVSRTVTLQNAQQSQAVAQAVLNSIVNLKKDFMTALSRKQDASTKMLIAELKND